MVIDTKVSIKETFSWIYRFLRAMAQLIAGRLGRGGGHRKAASSFHRPQEAVKERTGEPQDGFDKETRLTESQIKIL